MYRAAVIGISGYGSTHYEYLKREREAGHCVIAAATVINPDEEREKCEYLRSCGARIYADYREMLAQESIDLCFIPTGIGMHREMTEAALLAGANVYVEKPAAPTVADVEAMRKAERESNGKFVAVGYQHLYSDQVIALKRKLLAGEFGALRSIRVLGMWPRSSTYYQRNNWAGKLRDARGNWILDSPFNNAMAHYLNLSCFWGGESLAESAYPEKTQARLRRANPIESCDTAELRFQIRGKTAEILFLCTHASDETFGPEIRVECENGGFVWNNLKTTIYYADGRPEEIWEQTFEELQEELLEKLRNRLNNPEGWVCTLAIAEAETRCANAAHEAAPEIEDFPRERIRERTDEYGTWISVEGLEEELRAIFEKSHAFPTL